MFLCGTSNCLDTIVCVCSGFDLTVSFAGLQEIFKYTTLAVFSGLFHHVSCEIFFFFFKNVLLGHEQKQNKQEWFSIHSCDINL